MQFVIRHLSFIIILRLQKLPFIYCPNQHKILTVIDMDNKYWKNFLQTGRVEDYIKYVNNYYKSIDSINEKQEFQNAVNNEGLDNKGTDSWGE